MFVVTRLLATAPSLYRNFVTVSEWLFREMVDMLVVTRLLATAPSLYGNFVNVSEQLFREMADMLVVGGYQAAGYSTIIVL